MEGVGRPRFSGHAQSYYSKLSVQTRHTEDCSYALGSTLLMCGHPLASERKGGICENRAVTRRLAGWLAGYHTTLHHITHTHTKASPNPPDRPKGRPSAA